MDEVSAQLEAEVAALDDEAINYVTEVMGQSPMSTLDFPAN